MIKLLICDDQYVVREGLKAIFETDTDLQVVGTAADGAEALELSLPITSGFAKRCERWPAKCSAIHSNAPKAATHAVVLRILPNLADIAASSPWGKS